MAVTGCTRSLAFVQYCRHHIVMVDAKKYRNSSNIVHYDDQGVVLQLVIFFFFIITDIGIIPVNIFMSIMRENLCVFSHIVN